MRTLLTGYVSALAIVMTASATVLAADGCVQEYNHQRCETTERLEQFAPDAVHTIAVICPSSTRAFGGGHIFTNSSKLALLQNQRLAGGNGWIVSVINQSEAPVTSRMTALALCD